MKLVQFTEPNGETVDVVVDQVVDIKDATPGMYAPGARTVIVLSSGFQAVREPRAEVEQKLERV